MKMALDMEENYQKSLLLMKKAAAGGASLIVFPEIQLSPFFPQFPDQDVLEFVMRQDDQRITGICNTCRDNHIYAVPNFYIDEDGKRYDMSLLIDDDGSIIGKQKMVHVAQCEQFYEQSYYTPSDEGFLVFDTKLGKIGIVICFDRHFLRRTDSYSPVGSFLRSVSVYIIFHRKITAHIYKSCISADAKNIQLVHVYSSVNAAMLYSMPPGWRSLQ